MPDQPTCRHCLKRPATLFGGVFCSTCYRTAPLWELARSRVDPGWWKRAEETSAAYEAGCGGPRKPHPAWWRGKQPHR